LCIRPAHTSIYRLCQNTW